MALDLHLSRVRTALAAMRQDCNYNQLDTTKMGRIVFYYYYLFIKRAPTAPNVTGRQKRSSRTSTTQVTAYSPRFHSKGEVSTGASTLGPRD